MALLALMVAAPFLTATAQVADAPQTLWLDLTTGGAWVAGDGRSPASGLGYLLQGGVSWRRTGPWAVRGEVGYVHSFTGRSDMHWGRGTGESGTMLDGGGGWLAASVLRDVGSMGAGQPYLVAGAGIGQSVQQSALDGYSRSDFRPLLQAGAGVAWRGGSRAVSLELRALALPGASVAALRVPLSLGIRW